MGFINWSNLKIECEAPQPVKQSWSFGKCRDSQINLKWPCYMC